MSFIGYRGFSSNLLPELLAIKYDLLMTWDRCFKKVISNSDSRYIIRLIHDDFNKYYLFRVVIFYIKELLTWN